MLNKKIDRTVVYGNVYAVSQPYMSTKSFDLHALLSSGDYYLSTHKRSISTVYGQEIGIFFDDGFYYLSLDELKNTKKIHFAEAQKVLQECGGKLPTARQIDTILMNRRAINQSLQCIGMKEFSITEYVSELWNDEVTDDMRIRRLLVLKKAEATCRNEINLVPPRIIEDCCLSNRLPEGICAANYGPHDDYRLLQNTGQNTYYVLPVRIKTDLTHYGDPTCNGKVYLNGQEIIVENPIDSFIGADGKSYLKVIRNIMKKVNGFYALVQKEEKIIYR